MKKVLQLLTLTTFMASFVSAYDLPSALNNGTKQLIDIFTGLLSPIFYIIFGGQEHVFEKILFALIILSVVNIVVSRVEYFGQREKNKPLKWIITIAVTLLATRFLNESGLVQTMLLPYSVLGVTLTAVIPLVIYYFFVDYFDSGAVRRILWIFFVVIFIGLWSSRSDQLGDLSWIYILTALIGIILFIFDGTLRRMKIRRELKDMDNTRIGKYTADLRKELSDIRDNYKNGHMDKRTFKKSVKRIMEQIEEVSKHMI